MRSSPTGSRGVSPTSGGLAFAVHPGGILTPLQRHLPREEMVALGWLDENGELTEMAKAGFKTPEQGCSTTLWAATSAQARRQAWRLLRGLRHRCPNGPRQPHGPLPGRQRPCVQRRVGRAALGDQRSIAGRGVRRAAGRPEWFPRSVTDVGATPMFDLICSRPPVASHSRSEHAGERAHRCLTHRPPADGACCQLALVGVTSTSDGRTSSGVHRHDVAAGRAPPMTEDEALDQARPPDRREDDACSGSRDESPIWPRPRSLKAAS